MEIINMQMRHYLHNGKGYIALPYTKLMQIVMEISYLLYLSGNRTQ